MFGLDAAKFNIFIDVLHANIVKHLDDPNISVGIFLPLPLDLTSPDGSMSQKLRIFKGSGLPEPFCFYKLK